MQNDLYRAKNKRRYMNTNKKSLNKFLEYIYYNFQSALSTSETCTLSGEIIASETSAAMNLLLGGEAINPL